MNKVVFAILVLGLLGLAAVYVGSPLYMFQQLRQAAQAGDRDRLDALVDFPAVRENLKQQVDSKAVKLARQASGVGFPAVMVLGKLGAALGDRAVDKLVTPDAISAMVMLAHNPRAKKSRDEPQDAPATPAPPKVVEHYAYLSPDRFRIALSRPGDPDSAAVALILERQGLVTWRVEAIELPKP